MIDMDGSQGPSISFTVQNGRTIKPAEFAGGNGAGTDYVGGIIPAMSAAPPFSADIHVHRNQISPNGHRIMRSAECKCIGDWIDQYTGTGSLPSQHEASKADVTSTHTYGTSIQSVTGSGVAKKGKSSPEQNTTTPTKTLVDDDEYGRQAVSLLEERRLVREALTKQHAQQDLVTVTLIAGPVCSGKTQMVLQHLQSYASQDKKHHPLVVALGALPSLEPDQIESPAAKPCWPFGNGYSKLHDAHSDKDKTGYSFVWWLNAENTQSLRHDARALAVALGASGKMSRAKVALFIRAKLETLPNFLLVCDGVNDDSRATLQLVQALIPDTKAYRQMNRTQSRGRIIVTTRLDPTRLWQRFEGGSDRISTNAKCQILWMSAREPKDSEAPMDFVIPGSTRWPAVWHPPLQTQQISAGCAASCLFGKCFEKISTPKLSNDVANLVMFLQNKRGELVFGNQLMQPESATWVVLLHASASASMLFQLFDKNRLETTAALRTTQTALETSKEARQNKFIRNEFIEKIATLQKQEGALYTEDAALDVGGEYKLLCATNPDGSTYLDEIDKATSTRSRCPVVVISLDPLRLVDFPSLNQLEIFNDYMKGESSAAARLFGYEPESKKEALFRLSHTPDGMKCTFAGRKKLTGVSTRYECVKRCIYRAGFDLQSDFQGYLEVGTVITALESRMNSGGQLRVRFDQGWASVTAGTGGVLLISQNSPRSVGAGVSPEMKPLLDAGVSAVSRNSQESGQNNRSAEAGSRQLQLDLEDTEEITKSLAQLRLRAREDYLPAGELVIEKIVVGREPPELSQRSGESSGASRGTVSNPRQHPLSRPESGLRQVVPFLPGHVYLIMFCASWCSSCNKALHLIDELHRRYAYVGRRVGPTGRYIYSSSSKRSAEPRADLHIIAVSSSDDEKTATKHFTGWPLTAAIDFE
eukprot:COSAG01_NODE_2493_length_7581_cov_126.097167_2_plen_929_part_00